MKSTLSEKKEERKREREKERKREREREKEKEREKKRRVIERRYQSVEWQRRRHHEVQRSGLLLEKEEQEGKQLKLKTKSLRSALSLSLSPWRAPVCSLVFSCPMILKRMILTRAPLLLFLQLSFLLLFYRISLTSLLLVIFVASL